MTRDLMLTRVGQIETWTKELTETVAEAHARYEANGDTRALEVAHTAANEEAGKYVGWAEFIQAESRNGVDHGLFKRAAEVKTKVRELRIQMNGVAARATVPSDQRYRVL